MNRKNLLNKGRKASNKIVASKSRYKAIFNYNIILIRLCSIKLLLKVKRTVTKSLPKSFTLRLPLATAQIFLTSLVRFHCFPSSWFQEGNYRLIFHHLNNTPDIHFLLQIDSLP